jgi:SAM-dependent methyltransferase
MPELYAPRDDCRLCGGRAFDRVIDLGELALTGRFPAPGDAPVPMAPLYVHKCRACHLVQLAHDFDRDALFRQGYGYRSGINRTMTEHLQGIADAAMARVALAPGDLVLDIGSNDATLLRHYPAGIQVLGIDPTSAQYAEYYPAGALRAAEFFSEAAYRSLAGPRQARIISSIAMLYDLPDLHAFTADIARCLAPDGLWVFEQSYLPLMLETNAYDTICHEHLLYFSLGALNRLLTPHGLRIFHAELNDSNGGSSRVFACHAAAGFEETEQLAELRATEAAMGLETIAPYVDFETRVTEVRAQIREYLEAAHRAGLVVHGYGASTKGNTTLQHCGIGPELMQAIADRNPIKDGLLTPGTGIPIITEAASRAARPDVYFVLPWHFKDEFIEREAAFLADGGRLVFPLPNFEEVWLEPEPSPREARFGSSAGA